MLTEDNPWTQDLVTYGDNTARRRNSLSLQQPTGNNSRITNAFDNVGRLTLTKLRTSGGIDLNTHSYLYNHGHQRYRQTRTDASYVTYTYDNIGQLKSAIGTGSQSTENLGYAYDTAWNLNTRTNYGMPQALVGNVKNEPAAIGVRIQLFDDRTMAERTGTTIVMILSCHDSVFARSFRGGGWGIRRIWRLPLF